MVSVAALVQLGTAEPASALPGEGTVEWHYSSEANGYWRPPRPTSPGGGGGGGPATVWVQRNGTNYVACDPADPAFWCSQGEGPDDPTEITGMWCGTALRGPRGLPLFAWIRWERAIKPDGTPDKWIGKDADCDEPGDNDFVPMEEIRETARADVIEDILPPTLAFKPDPAGLVNLPVIVSTDYPAEDDPTIAAYKVPGSNPVQLRIPVTVDKNPGPDFQGEITAVLGDYVWRFRDQHGAVVRTISGRGPGRTYDPAVDPRKNPSYYISHTYNEVSHGNTVSLSTNWTGEVHVPGIADEPIRPIAVDATSPAFSVVQAKAVLGDR
jgi:hypothetical protein